MTPRQPRRSFWLLAALSTLLLLCGAFFSAPATAVTLDDAARALRKGDRVYDFAQALSRSDQQRLQDRLEALEKKGLAQGAIVIADRLEGVTIEEFALGLAERWKIGRADSDNGFVMAVSIADRKSWLEVAPDLQGTIPDAVGARLMRDSIVTPFREKQYAVGLDQALIALEQRLEKAGGVEALETHPVAPRSSPVLLWVTLLLGAGTVGAAFAAWPRGSVPGQDASRLLSIGLGFGALACAVVGVLQAPAGGFGLIVVGLVPALWAAARLFEGAWSPLSLNEASRLTATAPRIYWGALAAVTVLLFFVPLGGLLFAFLALAVPLGFAVRGYFARLPRKCLDCPGVLRWLPESEEPQFLKEGENLEQQLGSVDYDIWRCQKCHRSAVFPHPKLFTPYQECPRCHRRTLTTRTVLDAEPTAWQDGWASDVTECKNPQCGYHDNTRQRRVERGGYRDDGFGGVIIIPPIVGGWGGGGGGWNSGGSSGGDGGGGFDVGDFGGGGGFDGGGGGSDW